MKPFDAINDTQNRSWNRRIHPHNLPNFDRPINTDKTDNAGHHMSYFIIGWRVGSHFPGPPICDYTPNLKSRWKNLFGIRNPRDLDLGIKTLNLTTVYSSLSILWFFFRANYRWPQNWRWQTHNQRLKEFLISKYINKVKLNGKMCFYKDTREFVYYWR